MSIDISDLRKIGLSDVSDDDWTRDIYSVDASHYRTRPLAVCYPSDEHYVQRICTFANHHSIPITCRGAGTGLLGQSLSSGIILDFTKKMNKILEFEEDHVVVQPGVVKTVLDTELSKRDKFIPPDPASSNYCTIGGMICNNSSGPHGLGYGSIINYVQGVSVVYGNGTLGFADQMNYDDNIDKMLRYVMSLDDDIKKYYPNVSKNSSGYRLDAVFDTNNNHLQPQKVFLGSEGTLGIITNARISILDIPEKKSLIVLKFANIFDAARAVPQILEYEPVAIEILDRGADLEGWRSDNSNYGNSCIMFVEFYGNNDSHYVKVHNFEDNIREKAKILDSAHDVKSVNRAWNERRNSLNKAIKKGTGSRKPAGIIEDTVVRPDLLHDYLVFLLEVLATYKLDYVIYGHAGNGNLHLRPIIDINSKNSESLMNDIADNVFRRVVKLHGSISGEHGDGLVRTKYIPLMYGAKMYDIFKQIKLIFDDKKILNPGKKVL
jgi:glycolate dehydrogenase FAD-linked subunit